MRIDCKSLRMILVLITLTIFIIIAYPSPPGQSSWEFYFEDNPLGDYTIQSIAVSPDGTVL